MLYNNQTYNREDGYLQIGRTQLFVPGSYVNREEAGDEIAATISSIILGMPNVGLSAGFYPLFGAAGTGKSTVLLSGSQSFLHRLEDAGLDNDIVVMTMGEPDYFDSLSFTAGLPQLFKSLAQFRNKIYLIDSLRDLTLAEIDLTALVQAMKRWQGTEEASDTDPAPSIVALPSLQEARSSAVTKDIKNRLKLDSIVATLEPPPEANTTEGWAGTVRITITPSTKGVSLSQAVGLPANKDDQVAEEAGQSGIKVLTEFDARAISDDIERGVKQFEFPYEFEYDDKNSYLQAELDYLTHYYDELREKTNKLIRSFKRSKGAVVEEEFIRWSNATARGGISMSYLGALALIDQLAYQANSLVIAVLNPLLADDRVVEIATSIDAVTHGALRLTGQGQISGESLLRLIDLTTGRPVRSLIEGTRPSQRIASIVSRLNGG